MFDTITENNDKFFEDFAKLGHSINAEQLLSRIYLNGYNADDVDDMLDEALSFKALFRREIRHLKKRAATFLEEYGTDNNDCYANVGKYLFKIHRLLKQELKVFNLYCVNNHIKRPFREGLSLWDMQRLDFRTEFGQQLIPFKVEGVGQSKLNELTNLINDLYMDFVDCFLLCVRMLEGEVKIRKDFPRIRHIYDKTMLHIARRVTSLMIGNFKCPDSIDEIEDEMTKELLQAETDRWNEILAKYYHKRTPEELLIHYLLYNAYKKKYGFIPTPEEKEMWKEDIAHIQKVRKMIACFDELEPKGQMDKTKDKTKLSGKWVAKLMHWAIRGYDINKKDFVGYFNETYKGKFQTIDYGAVMAAYAALKAEEKGTCVIEFENFLNRIKAEEMKKTA